MTRFAPIFRFFYRGYYKITCRKHTPIQLINLEDCATKLKLASEIIDNIGSETGEIKTDEQMGNAIDRFLVEYERQLQAKSKEKK